MLKPPDGLAPRLPSCLRADIALKAHQLSGVASLDKLVRVELIDAGAILADDMGLGKTLQLLCLVLEELERRNAEADPVLVVAPVTLLES